MRPLVAILISVATFAVVVNGELSEGVARISDSEQKELEEEIVKAHNEYRAKHGVPPVKINKKISEYATEWANTLAREDRFAHRPNNKYGENISMSWGSSPKSVKDAARDAVKDWYNEEPLFKYHGNPADLSAGHFTQLIWKDTKEIGAGLARGKDNKVIVVCNYSPSGNWGGQYDSQCPRKK